MKKSEKEAIIDKAIELGFDKPSLGGNMIIRLPLGKSNSLILDTVYMEVFLGLYIKSEIDIKYDVNDVIPIRKIESPED